MNTIKLNLTADTQQRNSLMLRVTPCDPNNNQGIICEQDPEKINNFLRTEHFMVFMVTTLVPNFDSLN